MSSESRRILFLSVAVESAEFQQYDMGDLTTCRHTDLPFWLSVHDLDSNAVEYINACDGGPLPGPSGFRGVLVGGSMYSSYENRLWQQDLKSYLRNAFREAVPLLGVCGGHQLLVDALGGRVEANGRGRHIGAFPIHLTPSGQRDPFLAGVNDGALVQFVHGDIAVSLPADAVALASADHDPNAVIRYSPTAVSTQFHLEFSRDAIAHLVHHYSGGTEVVKVGGQVDTVPLQRRLLLNWLHELVA